MAQQTIKAGTRRIIFRKTAAETNGALLEMEALYAPGSDYPPDHYHPHQEEQFEVLSGNLKVRLNGREYNLQTGQTLQIPTGTPHSFCNDGDTEASFIWQVRPALQTQTYFETLYGLTDAESRPKLLQMAVLLQAYRAEVVLSRPAPAVQPLIFGPLALVGRLCGYRARYDRYSGSPSPAEGGSVAQASVWIDRPPAEVFSYIANFGNDPHWRAVRAMHQFPADNTEVGTTTHEELDFLGRRYVTTARITAFEAGRQLAWESLEATTPVSGWRSVTAEGQGTRFSEGISAHLQGVYRWFSPLMVRLFQKQMTKEVATLKQVLEQA